MLLNSVPFSINGRRGLIRASASMFAPSTPTENAATLFSLSASFSLLAIASTTS